MKKEVRILLIEDIPEDIKMVRRELEDCDFEIETAYTLEEGLKMLAMVRFDLVLLDLGLPDSKGLNTLTRLCAADAEIPVVVLTGCDDQYTALRSLESGAQDYLIKGQVNSRMLERAIRYGIERKKLEERERWRRQLSEAISAASCRFLETGDLGVLSGELLERCLAVSGAAFGMLLEQQDNGAVRLLATAARDGRNFAPADDRDPVCPCLAPVFLGQVSLVDRPRPASCPTGIHPPADSFLGLPLLVGNELVGALGLFAKPAGFEKAEMKLLEVFAQSAALAIRGARAELARARAMEHLRQAQKMEAIGQLAGGVAHDFNNLLSIINGYSTFLIRDLKRQKKAQSDAEQILQAGNRAAELVRQLMAFSRLQVTEPKVIQPNKLIGDMEKMLRRLIPENIRLITSLSDSVGRIKADPGQLEQIIINMTVNARDAMPEGGVLRIETESVELDADAAAALAIAFPGSFVRLTIGDTGSGMTESVRSRIFEPFFTTKELGRGTGLGLSTVYGIVKQSGGHIDVESEPGKGTTFSIFLPSAVEKPEDERRIAAAGEEEAIPTHTVLIVEDEKHLLDLMARTLRDCGLKVLAAATPSEACTLCEEHPQAIDLLITDMILPEMSGMQLTEVLQGKQQGMRVLFVSGYSFSEQFATGQGNPFLQKPFMPYTLAAKVREVLAAPAAETAASYQQICQAIEVVWATA